MDGDTLPSFIVRGISSDLHHETHTSGRRHRNHEHGALGSHGISASTRPKLLLYKEPSPREPGCLCQHQKGSIGIADADFKEDNNNKSSQAGQAIVNLTGTEYDRVIQRMPRAALLYLDPEDSEVIRVGSSFELEQRLQEPIPDTRCGKEDELMQKIYLGLQTPMHTFDIQMTGDVIRQWQYMSDLSRPRTTNLLPKAREWNLSRDITEPSTSSVSAGPDDCLATPNTDVNDGCGEGEERSLEAAPSAAPVISPNPPATSRRAVNTEVAAKDKILSTSSGNLLEEVSASLPLASNITSPFAVRPPSSTSLIDGFQEFYDALVTQDGCRMNGIASQADALQQPQGSSEVPAQTDHKPLLDLFEARLTQLKKSPRHVIDEMSHNDNVAAGGISGVGKAMNSCSSMCDHTNTLKEELFSRLELQARSFIDLTRSFNSTLMEARILVRPPLSSVLGKLQNLSSVASSTAHEIIQHVDLARQGFLFDAGDTTKARRSEVQGARTTQMPAVGTCPGSSTTPLESDNPNGQQTQHILPSTPTNDLTNIVKAAVEEGIRNAAMSVQVGQNESKQPIQQTSILSYLKPQKHNLEANPLPETSSPMPDVVKESHESNAKQERYKQVLRWRSTLETLLSGTPPTIDEVVSIESCLDGLTNSTDLEAPIIEQTKIHNVLKAIAQLPSASIPEARLLRIRWRCNKQWHRCSRLLSAHTLKQECDVPPSDRVDLVTLDRNSTGVDKGKGRLPQTSHATERDRGRSVARREETGHSVSTKCRPGVTLHARSRYSMCASRSISPGDLPEPSTRQVPIVCDDWIHTTDGALARSSHDHQSDTRLDQHFSSNATNTQMAARLERELLATRVGWFGSQMLQCYTQLVELGYGETMNLWKLADTVEACNGDLHLALDRLDADRRGNGL